MPEKVDFFDLFLEFLKAMEEDRRNSVKQEVQKASSPYGPTTNVWRN